MNKTIVLTMGVVLLGAGAVLAKEQPEVQVPPVVAEETAQLVNIGNKICPVSGDAVPVPGEKGEMSDEPVKIEHNGKIYNLCCEMCVKDFKKDPEKYTKIAEDEVAKSAAEVLPAKVQ